MERARGRTRRSFIGGVATTSAAGMLAGPLAAPLFGATPPDPMCDPSAPGFACDAIAASPDGRTIWTTDARLTTITAHRTRDLARRHSIDVGGAPTGIAIAPQGDLALVTTAFYDRPGLALVDLRTGEVDRLDVGPAPRAVAFAADGRSAYVAGGGRDGTLTRVDPRRRHVHAPLAIGADPHGLALTGDGEHALVALNGEAALALVVLGRRHRVRRIATAAFPHELAVAPDGHRALVSHNGFGARSLSVVDLERAHATHRVRVDADPGGVAYSRGGAHALVACAGTGSLIVLDGRTSRVRRRSRIGGVPRSVTAVGATGIVADKLSGRLQRVRLGALR